MGNDDGETSLTEDAYTKYFANGIQAGRSAVCRAGADCCRIAAQGAKTATG
jgi:hypothetical protein